MMHGQHWRPRVVQTDDMENFRHNGSTKGLDGTTSVKKNVAGTQSHNARIYYEAVRNLCGVEFFNEVYECGIGNPDVEEWDGKKLTISDLQAVYNAWQIARFVEAPRHIVEIGPGFGALAAMLRKVYPDTRITLVDLPEHHNFQRYYLEQTVGLDGIDVGSDLPDDADTVIAIRCMMEMPISEVYRYFDWLQALDTVQAFYLISRYLKWTMLKQYPFDNRWMPLISQPAFIQADMHEFLLARTEENASFLMQLESLPPYEFDGRFVDHSGRTKLYRTGVAEWHSTLTQV